ncbi:MAG: protein-disulfide reductase DsbD [Candidatus Eutrophobiaceae bacterium]
MIRTFCLFLLIALSGAAQAFFNWEEDSHSADHILDPDLAFVPLVEGEASGLRVSFDVQPGYYLYRQQFRFMLDGAVIALELPAGIEKEDEIFGRTQVYDSPIQWVMPMNGGILEIAYQGCKEDAICYPPQRKRFVATGQESSFAIEDVEMGDLWHNGVADTEAFEGFSAKEATDKATLVSPQSDPAQFSPMDKVAQSLATGNAFFTLLAFFGFGLLLSLTPCVYPMIPILSGILVQNDQDISTRRAFLMALVFVLAMASAYAVFGIIAASMHFNLQAAAQNPWLISIFSGIFVVLAFSCFGLFHLHIPHSWQVFLNRHSANSHNGSLLGSGIMGALSALIVGPCITPPLAGGLLYISQTGNVALGGGALFMMGLGFGVPLLVLACSMGKLLPLAGVWMNAVKNFFGIVLLAVAIWFLERIIPQPAAQLLWATLFIVTAVFIGALDRLQAGSSTLVRLRKGFGLVVLCCGVALALQASGLKFLGTGVGEGDENPSMSLFTRLSAGDVLDWELARAVERERPVMLYFYADWCVECHEMERETFNDPQLRTVVPEKILALKVDITDNNAQDRNLLERYSLFGPPAIIFFDAQGQELSRKRLVGFVERRILNRSLEDVLAGGL